MSIFDPLLYHDARVDRRGEGRHWQDRHWQDRRWEERRLGGDRRSGLDRRSQGLRQPLQAEARAYGFREFSDRRNRQDRRIYRMDGEAWDRRAESMEPADRETLRSLLTDEEIRYLLRCGRRRS